MEEQFIIDTNAAIDYLGGKLPPSAMAYLNDVINTTPNISVITQIEILSFTTNPTAYQLLKDFIQECVIFDINQSIVQKTIHIRQTHKTKLPDAIIAATSIVHDLTLITRNISDFKNIEGLQILNPYEL